MRRGFRRDRDPSWTALVHCHVRGSPALHVILPARGLWQRSGVRLRGGERRWWENPSLTGRRSLTIAKLGITLGRIEARSLVEGAKRIGCSTQIFACVRTMCESSPVFEHATRSDAVVLTLELSSRTTVNLVTVWMGRSLKHVSSVLWRAWIHGGEVMHSSRVLQALHVAF